MPNNPNNFKANPGDRNEGKEKLAFPETAELGDKTVVPILTQMVARICVKCWQI